MLESVDKSASDTGHMAQKSLFAELGKDFPENFDTPDPNHLLWKLNEAEALSYVSQALMSKQEYDAGNGILFLSQTGRLTKQGIEKVADMLLATEGFKSKIGRKLFPKLAGSLGNGLLKYGEAKTGQKLLNLMRG